VFLFKKRLVDGQGLRGRAIWREKVRDPSSSEKKGNATWDRLPKLKEPGENKKTGTQPVKKRSLWAQLVSWKKKYFPIKENLGPLSQRRCVNSGGETEDKKIFGTERTIAQVC